MIDRHEIVAAARGYIGWGWGHQRRGPDKVDCVGLPIMVARGLGMVPQDFDITGYSRISDLPRLVGEFRKYMTERPRTACRPGDLVILRDSVFPCHCGIIGEKPYGLSLIHARGSVGRPAKGAGLRPRGMVREEPYSADLTTHAFSFPGVPDG